MFANKAWSTANYNEIEHQAGDIRDEIVSMVGNLQLPDWYIRHMLGGGSAIASVCAGTPKGENFLQVIISESFWECIYLISI